MQVFTTIKTIQEALLKLKKEQIIGFVPTMGALHKGHLSLIKNAKKKVDIVVVSIFVNPTQFDNKEDLDNYPLTLQEDIQSLQQEKCDFLFIPTVKEMYTEGTQTKSYIFDGLEHVMEGAHRVGHFDGVGTIVAHLLEIVKPHFSFFGEKDFQQLQIIRKLVEKEQIDTIIVGVPIYREADGLAMSSRNVRLTEAYRKDAPFIYKTLQKAKDMYPKKGINKTIKWVEDSFEKHPALRLEYFSIAREDNLKPVLNDDTKPKTITKYRGFIAVFAGHIRLIDNIAFY